MSAGCIGAPLFPFALRMCCEMKWLQSSFRMISGFAAAIPIQPATANANIVFIYPSLKAFPPFDPHLTVKVVPRM